MRTKKKTEWNRQTEQNRFDDSFWVIGRRVSQKQEAKSSGIVKIEAQWDLKADSGSAVNNRAVAIASRVSFFLCSCARERRKVVTEADGAAIYGIVWWVRWVLLSMPCQGTRRESLPRYTRHRSNSSLQPALYYLQTHLDSRVTASHPFLQHFKFQV